LWSTNKSLALATKETFAKVCRNILHGHVTSNGQCGKENHDLSIFHYQITADLMTFISSIGFMA
jgi:hypothetical protein